MGCFGRKSKKSRPSSQKCKQKAKQQKAWTQDEWKIHGRYLKQLAAPKKDFAVDQSPAHPKVPLYALQPRMTSLAQPKTINRPHSCKLAPKKCHCHIADPIREVHPDAKNYVPTRRIEMLSQPKLDYQEVIRCFPKRKELCVKKIFQPRSSNGMMKLAMPKHHCLCAPDSDPYGVKPEALSAVATERTRKLAQPKKLNSET
ncbi:uncharacterized protein LOC131431935 [Malaya genurostris]|uniref:uncharacterized protein LOC131431935 n=1 Tax=Malaya genurostris TaxID=325434 RepID=UPI0026F3AA39|nr:uncharacterized protein LOC131431935 [Malaya genurostris]